MMAQICIFHTDYSESRHPDPALANEKQEAIAQTLIWLIKHEFYFSIYNQKEKHIWGKLLTLNYILQDFLEKKGNYKHVYVHPF